MIRRTWAVVPAKSLVRGKSRLRAALDDEKRIGFARRLVEHTLDTLAACHLEGVLVATDGEDVAKLAEARGAQVLWDGGQQSLAGVVDRALADVASRDAQIAVVLMADLPRIERNDVEALIAALSDYDVALVQDHMGHHTNALALAPPTAIATSFGHDDSFALHLQAARAASLRTIVVDNPRIAFDVDLPADHQELTMRRPGVGT